MNNNSIEIEVISQLHFPRKYTLPKISKTYSIFAQYTKVYTLLVIGYKSRKSRAKVNEAARTLRTMRHFRNNNRVTPQNSCLPFHFLSAQFATAVQSG